ncbi:hypothetical protein J4234_00740 [Candidatus Woesearchaeota archaeon]|nr:hypothetical protein [Candidatus Woesearchaeota archaeon]
MSSKDGLEKVLGLVGLAFLLGRLGEEDRQQTLTIEQKTPVSEKLEPRYNAYESPYGLVLEIDGYVLGSILDQPFFRKDWVEKYPGSLEVILAAEKIAQVTLKDSGPRIHSGAPGYEHIRRVMQKVIESAEAIRIELDSSTIIPGILHDEIELKVRKLEDLWKQYTVFTRYETDPQLRRMYQVLRDRSGIRLTEMRTEIKDDLEEKLTKAIPGNITAYYKQKNMRDIKKGTSSTIRLTRFNDRYRYPDSMEFQFSRYGNEPLDQTYKRAALKFCDGMANMEETHSLPRATLEQITLAGKDMSPVGRFIVGQELTERFGDVDIEVREMLPSIMVQTAFVRVFPFHYFNEHDNKYGRQVLESEDQETINMRKLALYNRDNAIDTADRLLGKAIKKFEERPEIKEVIPQVAAYIKAKLEGDFFDKVTWSSDKNTGGVIMPLIEYDVRGREFIERQDSSLEGMRFMYRAARVLQVLMPRFKMYEDRTLRRHGIAPTWMHDTLKFDVHRHRWRTLGNMDEALKLMPSLQDMIAEYKGPPNGQLALF